jgi:copper(I)-binding protein
MNKIYLVLAAFCFTLLNISGDVFAAEHSNQITVEGSYIRAKIPGTDITSAYMTIKNKGDEAVMLIGASSQFSDRIEIHQHTMSDGMMKMRQVQQLLIKDKNQVILQPMGYHLMIFNVKEALQAEQKVSLTLHFKQQKDLVVTIPVQSIKKERTVKKQHHHH